MFCRCPYSDNGDESDEVKTTGQRQGSNSRKQKKKNRTEEEATNKKVRLEWYKKKEAEIEIFINDRFIHQISELSSTIENWVKEIANLGVQKKDKKILNDGTDKLLGVTSDLNKLNRHDRDSRLAEAKKAASMIEEVLYRTRIACWLNDIQKRGLFAKDKDDIEMLNNIATFFWKIYDNGNTFSRLEESKEAARKVLGFWKRVTGKSRIKESENIHLSLI